MDSVIGIRIMRSWVVDAANGPLPTAATGTRGNDSLLVVIEVSFVAPHHIVTFRDCQRFGLSNHNGPILVQSLGRVLMSTKRSSETNRSKNENRLEDSGYKIPMTH